MAQVQLNSVPPVQTDGTTLVEVNGILSSTGGEGYPPDNVTLNLNGSNEIQIVTPMVAGTIAADYAADTILTSDGSGNLYWLAPNAAYPPDGITIQYVLGVGLQLITPVASTSLASSPTSGYILQTDGTNNSWQPAGAGSGNLVKVSDTTVAVSTDTVTITGVTANNRYVLLVTILVPVTFASSSNFTLQWNSSDYSNTTTTLVQSNSSQSYFANVAVIGFANASGDYAGGSITIDTTTAAKTATCSMSVYSPSDTTGLFQMGANAGSDVSTAQTEITITTGGPLNIGAGSRFTLYQYT